MKKLPNNKDGFTLLELLIVVVAIIILGVVIFSSYTMLQ